MFLVCTEPTVKCPTVKALCVLACAHQVTTGMGKMYLCIKHRLEGPTLMSHLPMPGPHPITLVYAKPLPHLSCGTPSSHLSCARPSPISSMPDSYLSPPGPHPTPPLSYLPHPHPCPISLSHPHHAHPDPILHLTPAMPWALRSPRHRKESAASGL